MRQFLSATILAAAVAGVGLFPSPSLAQGADAAGAADVKPAKESEVPVKVVVLFSSGVGYFEHVGPVKGEASTELRFKTQQINDILKSLVVQDTKGKVGTVVYPSQDPIAKTLKSFQVDITANPSLAELLNQLRGAKVSAVVGTETLTATILGAEKEPKSVPYAKDKPQPEPVEAWYLNLISGGTIRQVALDEVSKIELQDPTLREELNKALEALAKARDQDKKPVTIGFSGEGERLVRIGYVVETPVWKTSYRLLLDPKADATKGPAKANLQGWAIVENQTDNDWTGVQLSLISGRPISFIQELYQPLYIPRPVVYPELFASLRPQTYEGGMNKLRQEVAAADEAAEGTSLASRYREAEKKADGSNRAPGAPPMAGRGAAAKGGGGGFGGGGAGGPGSADKDLYDQALKQAIDPSASVSSIASASKAGELFQYTVGSVTLPRQKSAMIPIVTDTVDVQKFSIYNQGVLAKHPLNGAKLKNTSGKHLLQGPITVFEANSYAGDAKIENLPPGQERLISYGIDLQVVANASKNKQETAIVGGKVVKGVMQLQRKNAFTQEYAFENKAEADKTVIVEHPFRQNWKLITPEKALETTEGLYRFNQSVAAGKTASLTVKEEIVQAEHVQILPMDTGTMISYARSGEIPKPVRDALTKAIGLKQAMVDSQRLVEKYKQDIAQITQEQVRIRENIKTAPDKGTLQTRLLQKLEDQEKQIDDLLKKQDDAQKDFEGKRKELEDYVNNLNID